MSPRRAPIVLCAALLGVAAASCRRRAPAPPEAPGPPPVKILYPSAPSSFVKLVARLAPSLVQLSTNAPVRGGPADWFPSGAQGEGLPPGEAGERMRRALGSGFIVEADGTIVTNARVIGKDREVRVRLHEGGEHVARVLGRDEASDIAVIKIEPPAGLRLQPVRIGDSAELELGEWVIALGNPFGQGLTVSAGVVSGKDRRDLPAGRAGYLGFIQTDAAIHAGNSGGPLLNAVGEVVGVNTAVAGAEASRVGFAVPMKLVRKILPMLKREGRVVRTWVGAYMNAVSEEAAERAGLKKPLGALVTQVVPRGPAERAGLRAGDIILAFDGKDVVNASELPWVVSLAGVGRNVMVRVWRDGKPLAFTLQTERMPE
jgi:serine protease Do